MHLEHVGKPKKLAVGAVPANNLHADRGSAGIVEYWDDDAGLASQAERCGQRPALWEARLAAPRGHPAMNVAGVTRRS